MYGLKGCCSQVIFREVFCHEYGKIPRHTGQNPITEGDMEWILTKLLWTEWTVTLKVKNVYGQSHLCLDSFISASGGSSYLSFLTLPIRQWLLRVEYFSIQKLRSSSCTFHFYQVRYLVLNIFRFLWVLNHYDTFHSLLSASKKYSIWK